MDDVKLSPKTLLEQEAGRKAVAQRAMADASAQLTASRSEAKPAEPDVVVPAPKSSKKST